MREEPLIDELPDTITEDRGAFWVLISVPSASEDGFDVNVEVGPGLEIVAVKNLLAQTLTKL